MACIDSRDIPPLLLPPAPSQIKQCKALGVLKAYAFTAEQPINQFLNLHRLVHLAIRNWLRNENTLNQWTIKTGARLNRVFPDDDHRNQRLWREYLPHAQSILQRKEFHYREDNKAELQGKVGKCLHSDGRYNEAEALFLERLEHDKKTRGPNHLDTLADTAWVAFTYRKQGRWTEAEKLEAQVMETRTTVLGPEHLDTLTSMANLAHTYRDQGRWTEAEKPEAQVMVQARSGGQASGKEED
jgi:tetratricopeptide (TPR) repeat protein